MPGGIIGRPLGMAGIPGRPGIPHSPMPANIWAMSDPVCRRVLELGDRKGPLVDLGDFEPPRLRHTVLAVADEAQREMLSVEQLRHPQVLGRDARHRNVKPAHALLRDAERPLAVVARHVPVFALVAGYGVELARLGERRLRALRLGTTGAAAMGWRADALQFLTARVQVDHDDLLLGVGDDVEFLRGRIEDDVPLAERALGREFFRQVGAQLLALDESHRDALGRPLLRSLIVTSISLRIRRAAQGDS